MDGFGGVFVEIDAHSLAVDLPGPVIIWAVEDSVLLAVAVRLPTAVRSFLEGARHDMPQIGDFLFGFLVVFTKPL